MTPLQYVIAALLVTNIVTGTFWKFASNRVDYLELQMETAAANEKRKEEEREQINKDTVEGWKAALDYTRSYYAKRLHNAGVQPMPGISGPPGGINGLAPDALAIASDCAETTLMLFKLQEWARKQGKVQ